MAWHFTVADDAVDLSVLAPGDVLVDLAEDDTVSRNRMCASGVSCMRVSEGRLFSARDVAAKEGVPAIYASLTPMLIWPGAEDGTVQVFGHADWPGAYGAVNVHPSLWDGCAPSVEEIVQRAMLLPDWPVAITGGPRSGCGAACRTCSSPVDLRFAFGHGWKEADLVRRAGTEEVLAEIVRSDFLWQDGPTCQNCIEAGFSMNELRAPSGYAYDHRQNRSAPVAEEPLRAAATEAAENFTARSRYGAEAYAWRVPEPPERTRQRIGAIRELLGTVRHVSCRLKITKGLEPHRPLRRRCHRACLGRPAALCLPRVAR